MTPNLNLIVPTAQVFQISPGKPSTEIACTVNLTIAIGVIHKALCCQLGIVQIAKGKTCPSNTYLSRNTLSLKTAPAVQYIE
ncbi:hypothetical protein D3C71_696170 [compost metagenome]